MKKIFAVALLSLSSCASLNEKYVAMTEPQAEAAMKWSVGKTPKEVTARFGKPISAGYLENDPNAYYVVYPIGSDSVSKIGFMTGGENMYCAHWLFHNDNAWKFTLADRTIPSCTFLKQNHRYDESRIN